jgi:predicted nucleic acid-binding protein
VGSLALPPQGAPYLDTNGFIYSIERIAPYQALLDPFWQEVRAQGRVVVTSELTVMETLVKPFQTQDQALEAAFRAVLFSASDVRLAPVSRAILEQAARLRASTGLKTPDAVHAATALDAGCTLFVTNDAAFRRVTGLNVVVLHELLAP